MNIKQDKMMLAISNMKQNKSKLVEMMDHMLRNTTKLALINQLLTNMLHLTSTKLNFQLVLNKMILNWEITFKLNSQETTLMMLNTLKLLKTQSITLLMLITVQCNKKVKINIKLSMILKYWLIFKDSKELTDCLNIFCSFILKESL